MSIPWGSTGFTTVSIVMGDRVWNTAIWNKTWGDQRGLVLALVALWGVFPWLFLWLSSQIQMNAFQDVLLQAIPKDWQRLSGVPFSDVATHAGRVALAFVDPVVVLAATVWGITRGSDAVSGQLERGTMEMLLAQPVRRQAVWVTQALATTAASATLCGVLALSVCGAVAFGPWAGKVEPQRFLLPVANVFGLMVCLAGISACLSAADTYRWRTIGSMCGFYVFSLLAKLVGRIVADEDRHQKFFDNLVAHCLENHRDSTIAAISRRAPAFPVIGGDILEYRETKLRTVAEAGIFDQAAADKVVSDGIAAWGLADEPHLEKFVSA